MIFKKTQSFRVGENKVSFSQTSKGVWYCNDLTIYCKDIFDGVALMSGAIDAVDKILEEQNKVVNE